MRLSRPMRRQRGVAVVTALLLTTLAITIVASLFWQQQVQVRSIENQRMQLQKKWILRGAIDWARLILREDARQSAKVDYLGEPWAVKLADTRLDQYVENGRAETEESDATLSGQIVDAQASYNLNNLATNGVIDPRELAAFSRLLANLRLSPDLAQAAADMIAASQPQIKTPAGAPDSSPASAARAGSGVEDTKTDSANNRTEVQFLRPVQVEDLLAVSGYTPEIVEKLRSYVMVLPRKTATTAVNLNTAPAEVLAARIEGVSMADAALMVASRDRAYFRDLADFHQRFPDKGKTTTDKDIQVWTQFFVVNGKVKMNRSLMDVSALIERADDGATTVLWVRDN